MLIHISRTIKTNMRPHQVTMMEIGIGCVVVAVQITLHVGWCALDVMSHGRAVIPISIPISIAHGIYQNPNAIGFLRGRTRGVSVVSSRSAAADLH